MSMEREARRAIASLQQAANEYAAKVYAEMELEARRPAKKAEAVARIMASGDNPLTNRPHSASSAEAIVETDHGYAAHLAETRDVVLAKNLAYTTLTTERLNAELAIALCREAVTA